jgi:exopolysaccharide biosynthesis polyprenyl glycosylphosphotransferase
MKAHTPLIELPDEGRSRIHWFAGSETTGAGVTADFHHLSDHRVRDKRNLRSQASPTRKETAKPSVAKSVEQRPVPKRANADQVVRAKSSGAPVLLKVFDLIILIAAFVLIVAPSTPSAFLSDGSASTRDTALFGHIGHAPLTFYGLLGVQISIQGLFLTCAFLACWYIIFSALGLYSANHVRRIGTRHLMYFVAVAVLGAATIWMASLLIDLGRNVIAASLSAVVVACCVSLLARLVAGSSIVRRAMYTAKTRRHVIIVGTNRRAVELARRIDKGPWGRMKLVGFVDHQWAGDGEFRQSGYEVVSGFAEFQDYLKDHVVDEVVICTPLKSLYGTAARIFAQCEKQGITVRFRSDPVSPTIGRFWIDELEGQPVLTVNSTPQRQFSLYVKRLIDIAGSAAVLLLGLPLMLGIALAIKLTSDGPVFFTQERVGLNKRRFPLYKFRTMVIDAEQRLASLESKNEVSGPVFKIKRDPRVTPLGRFLRKSSLDELPQLLNVLRGEMSLVGPRPLAVRDYRGITEDWQRRRLSVKPGITCLWQVRGRNSIPFQQWMEMDLEYIDNWSLLLDLKICMQTIPAVISGSGAS